MCNHDCETIQTAKTCNKTHFRLKITGDKKQKVITDVIILGYNSTSSIKIFIVKKIIRNITNSRSMDSCRDLFKKMNILPLFAPHTHTHTHTHIYIYIYIQTLCRYTLWIRNNHTQRTWRFIFLILDTISIFVHPSLIWLNFRMWFITQE
jgi:hypothetical protein